MPAITDYIAILIVLFFFWRGWNKGLFQLLLGPFSIVLGMICGYIAFIETQNLLIGIGAGVVLPIILRILISLFWNINSKTKNKMEDDEEPETKLGITHLIAGLLNVVWGGSLFFIALIVIPLIPLEAAKLPVIQNDIKQSQTYALLDKITQSQMPKKQFNWDDLKNQFKDPFGVKKNLKKMEDAVEEKNRKQKEQIGF